MKSLAKKRRDTALLIVGAAAGTGAASSAPTVSVEIPKQFAIGAADLVLCAGIYRIYFDQEIESDDIWRLITEAGLVTAAGIGAGYVGVKLTEGVVAEVLNWVPVIGWGLSGLITASVTATVGCGWWYLCDSTVRGESTVLTQPAN